MRAATVSLLVVLVGSALAAEPDGFGPGRKGTLFAAMLNAANQAPAPIPVTNGKAEFVLQLDDASQSATYTFGMKNILGYTMSHIHAGGKGVNGPPVVLLLPARTPPAVNLTALPMLPPFDICSLKYSSKFNKSDLVSVGGSPLLSWTDFVAKLKNGTLYVNIHNAAYPAGVIRGQLYPSRMPPYDQCSSSFGKDASDDSSP